MEQLNEILISDNMLPNMKWSRDLIYFEGPLLSHFISIYKEDFLFYWVDSDSEFNRWLVFRVSGEELKGYLKKEKTLYQIITNKEKGHLYKVDINNDRERHNLSLLNIDNIPDDYLPELDSYYPENIDFEKQQLEIISEKEESPVLQAYFNNSENVGLGEIELEVFAPILNDINNIHNGIRRLYLKREREKFNSSQRILKRKDRKQFDNSKFSNACKLTFFGKTSNSFGALLKAPSNDNNNQELASIQDKYIEYLISFFEAAQDSRKFSEFVGHLDKIVIESYKDLLSRVEKYRLQFNLNYENAFSNHNKSSKIPYTMVPNLLQNINESNTDDTEDITLYGRFTALNLNTGSYQFTGNEFGSDFIITSTGHLDRDRKVVAYKISWDKEYKVIITRTKKKTAGSKRMSIRDLLVSFTEIEDAASS